MTFLFNISIITPTLILTIYNLYSTLNDFESFINYYFRKVTLRMMKNSIYQY